MTEKEYQKARDIFYNNFLSLNLAAMDDNDLSYYRKPVIQFDSKHNKLKRYDSVMEAATQNSLSIMNITQCLMKRNKTAGGYIWEYENDI